MNVFKIFNCTVWNLKPNFLTLLLATYQKTNISVRWSLSTYIKQKINKFIFLICLLDNRTYICNFNEVFIFKWIILHYFYITPNCNNRLLFKWYCSIIECKVIYFYRCDSSGRHFLGLKNAQTILQMFSLPSNKISPQQNELKHSIWFISVINSFPYS